jgi:hypothetical protein
MSEYAVPVLCCVIAIFVGWIILLKTEVAELRRERAKLQAALDRATALLKGDVEVRGAYRVQLHPTSTGRTPPQSTSSSR